MEKLTINIPEKKSTLVKQILKALEVTIEQKEPKNISIYKQKITNVSIWTDDDVKVYLK